MSVTEKNTENKRLKFDWYLDIANIVSSVCEVSLDDVLNNRDRLFFAQCRWLIWYAYRRFTKEPYERIHERTKKSGCEFSSRAIGSGITKMSVMIDSDSVWKERWEYLVSEVHNITGENISNSNTDSAKQYEIVVQVPKNVKVKIKEI